MERLVREYNDYFIKLWGDTGNIDRYGIPFATQNYTYFFDAGTGKVLQCAEETYKLLVHLFECGGKIDTDRLELSESELSFAMEELMEGIEQEHICQAKEGKPDKESYDTGLEEIIHQGCTQLILEVTESCNLRCNYCIYGSEHKNFRDYGNNHMTYDTAKKAVDYFVSMVKPEGDIHLTFYGGEPLINFQVIKMATEYFKECTKQQTKNGRNIRFGLTSNLTLLTREMAEYFADNDFYIVCSLDGDKDIHDKNRPYMDGTGSFDYTLEGLKVLYYAYGNKADKLIGVNVVIDKPYTDEKFDKINDFFSQLEYVPDKKSIRTSYVGHDVIWEDTELSPNIKLIKQQNSRLDNLCQWEFRKLMDKEDILLRDMLDDTLRDVHRRRINDMPFTEAGINACCIPGTGRLYVTVDGNFMPCERIGISPYIGHVDSGLDIDSIRKYYIDDYIEQSRENCGKCFAYNMCNVCYAGCFGKDGLDMRRKKELCEATRYALYNGLIRYHTLLEEKTE